MSNTPQSASDSLSERPEPVGLTQRQRGAEDNRPERRPGATARSNRRRCQPRPVHRPRGRHRADSRVLRGSGQLAHQRRLPARSLEQRRERMSWYRYHQNNSGGSHEYDPDRGISVEVYVEADSADRANERAREIGLYFDGVDGGWDCSCCGDRWYEETYAQDDDFEPPTEDEALLIDENARFNPIKWAGEGNYETFVHPKGKPFYGAHAEVERIARKIKG